MTDEQKATLQACMQIAYEAWKRAGQVELEEHMENWSLADNLLEYIKSKKTSMPDWQPSEQRKVVYTLRTEERGNWVKKSSKAYFDSAFDLFCKFVQ